MYLRYVLDKPVSTFSKRMDQYNVNKKRPSLKQVSLINEIHRTIIMNFTNEQ